MNTIPSPTAQAEAQDVVPTAARCTPEDIDNAVTAAFSIAFRKHGDLAHEAPKRLGRLVRATEGEGA